MRINDGRCGCALCGFALDIPLTQDPQVMIAAASGKPNMRVLSKDGRELHRCEIGAAERSSWQQPA